MQNNEEKSKEVYINHFQAGKVIIRELEEEKTDVFFIDSAHHFIFTENEVKLLENLQENLRMEL